MRVEHTLKKTANRVFDKFWTGFASSEERKAYFKSVYSQDKTHKGFTKKKPIRVKKIRQSIKNK